MRSIVSYLTGRRKETPRIPTVRDSHLACVLLLEIQIQLSANRRQENLMINKQKNSVRWTSVLSVKLANDRIQLQMRTPDLSRQTGVAEHLETVVALRILTTLKTWCPINHSPYFRVLPPTPTTNHWRKTQLCRVITMFSLQYFKNKHKVSRHLIRALGHVHDYHGTYTVYRAISVLTDQSQTRKK